MAAILLLTGRSMCPRRHIDPVELHGLAAVQLTADEPWSNSRPALPMPPGADVAVWPEGVYPDGVVLVEGHQRRKLPHWGAESPRLWHLLGLEGRHRRGAMNMTSLIDPTGTLVWARAKRTLVPLGEAAWKGIPSLGDTFVPGVVSANVRVADHSLAVLLCYELYDRSRFAEALVGEATVVALQSSDRPLQASSIAREQVLNTMRLRSAEFGLPIVRASVGGEAAITLPNGVLHRTGRIGTNMTLDGTSTLLAE